MLKRGKTRQRTERKQNTNEREDKKGKQTDMCIQAIDKIKTIPTRQTNG